MPINKKYYTLLIKEVPEDQEKSLYNCSFKYRGYMWSEFNRHRKSRTAIIVICKINNLIIGWGIKFYEKSIRKKVVMLYVKKPYRRKGIGSKILNKLIGDTNLKLIKAYPDSKSLKFFNHNKIKT